MLDVWFSRHNDKLVFALADHDEPPRRNPKIAPSVGYVLRSLRAKGHEIAQVGICDYDMIRKYT